MSRSVEVSCPVAGPGGEMSAELAEYDDGNGFPASHPWAGVDSVIIDGERFEHLGHLPQVDVVVGTHNRLDKARRVVVGVTVAEVRLNRQAVWRQASAIDVPAMLGLIAAVVSVFSRHPAIDWADETPVARQLSGRAVAYRGGKYVTGATTVTPDGKLSTGVGGDVVSVCDPHLVWISA